MVEEDDETCDHKWDSSRDVRICYSCGQIRTFPSKGEIGRIIWQGESDKRDPKELPSSDKYLIAVVSKAVGLKKAKKWTGIPMNYLRAWVGRFTRSINKQKKEAKKPEVKAAPIPAITMAQLIPPEPCFICRGEVFPVNPTPRGKLKPCCIDTGKQRIYFCGPCADGVKRLLTFLGIECQVEIRQ